MLPPDEKRSRNILKETTVIKDNDVETGLLWKSDVSHLLANRKMAINRQLSKEQAKSNSEMEIYIPHHGVLTLFRIRGATSFFPVTSTNVELSGQNFLTFSFFSFATLV